VSAAVPAASCMLIARDSYGGGGGGGRRPRGLREVRGADAAGGDERAVRELGSPSRRLHPPGPPSILLLCHLPSNDVYVDAFLGLIAFFCMGHWVCVHSSVCMHLLGYLYLPIPVQALGSERRALCARRVPCVVRLGPGCLRPSCFCLPVPMQALGNRLRGTKFQALRRQYDGPVTDERRAPRLGGRGGCLHALCGGWGGGVYTRALNEGVSSGVI
jgi:hypothetical protein